MAVYRRPNWDALFQEGRTPWQREGLNPAYHNWKKYGTLVPGRILVPGCGGSHEVLALAQAGFDVTALDLSETAIAYQREHLDEAGLEAQFETDDVLTWIPNHTFDMIYDQTCLCALVPSDRHHYERQLHLWLKHEGKLLMLFMQTGEEGGPPYDCHLGDMHELFPEERWHWSAPPYFRSNHSGQMYEYAVVLTRDR